LQGADFTVVICYSESRRRKIAPVILQLRTMADLISVPLKKPSEIDIVKPLKNLIAASYSTADKPEDYSEAINEFSKLRNNAVWRAFEKYESSLEVIYRFVQRVIHPSNMMTTFLRDRLSTTMYFLFYASLCSLNPQDSYQILSSCCVPRSFWVVKVYIAA